jgi:amino acid adenylation domain-containing protein
VSDIVRSQSEVLTIHRLFEAQAERTPDAVAAVFESTSLSYRELNQRANALARRLRDTGVGPDVLVSVLFNRSLEMLIAILGVLKAGGAYVPLDPTNPRERLALMLSDSQAPLILTQSHFSRDLPENNAQLIYLEPHKEAGGDIDGEGPETPAVAVTADNLAYVIYTSGSTGKPKGVEITHRSVVNFLTSMRQETGIVAGDILLAVTTLSFDIAGLELFLPLTVGAKVVIAGQDVVADGPRLIELLKKSGTTVMQATPATWRLLLDAGWGGDKNLKILCGGESLPRLLANQLLNKSASLWNMYGPTETTIWSTLFKVTREPGAVSIGKPIANTQLYILDESLRPLSAGEVGELYIGGIGLAKGYRGRAELTSERFLPDPFAKGRLYKTGDLARQRPDGMFECLGRTDFQVKIRGFRIELGEIENVLAEHATVKDAVVMAREDGVGEKRLVAYVIPKPGQSLDFTALRELTKDKLPAYMQPSLFITLEKFPLTSNLKVDRKALPEPDWTRTEDRSENFEHPTGPMEIKLAEMWTRVLGIKKIGRHDNFISIGGNSITLTRLSHQISEVFDIQIPTTILYLKPTIALMAEAVLQRRT